jgi:hypothetical protein
VSRSLLAVGGAIGAPKRDRRKPATLSSPISIFDPLSAKFTSVIITGGNYTAESEKRLPRFGVALAIYGGLRFATMRAK